MADHYYVNETLKNDPVWLTEELVCFMLNLTGYDVDKPTCDSLRDEYFKPDQIGIWENMVPGMIDVSRSIIQQ